MAKQISVAPSAKRLTNSLRDVGYTFESAVADLIDNSITAGATRVDITIDFAGRESQLIIVDNGYGMPSDEINEAMRFGSRRSYGTGDLGRYGLGLKTASLSQCRRLEVISRHAHEVTPQARVLDLDFIQAVDDWITLDTSNEADTQESLKLIGEGSGTILIWRKLDRLLPSKATEGGWARRRIEKLSPRLVSHLSMVFHRFLAGETSESLAISVNGEDVRPWDPFFRSEESTQLVGTDRFEVEHGDVADSVILKRYLLPSREKFSSREAFESASGPEKWNKQQGIYIYRANRLVQWGGWAGIRTIDEHTKLARVSLDFETDLDEAFNINVAKMRVSVPSQLKKMLARPINELCIEADAAYRRNMRNQTSSDIDEETSHSDFGSDNSGDTIGLALRAAAVRTGGLDALEEIADLLRSEMPALAKHLGFD